MRYAYDPSKLGTYLSSRNFKSKKEKRSEIMCVLMRTYDGKMKTDDVMWRKFLRGSPTTMSDGEFHAIVKIVESPDPYVVAVSILPDSITIDLQESDDRSTEADNAPIKFDSVITDSLLGKYEGVCDKIFAQIDSVRFLNANGLYDLQNYLVVSPSSGLSGSIIVAFDPDLESIALVEQYRYPVRTNTYEVPRGFALPSEEPSKVAFRELLEEAGVKPRSRINDNGQVELDLFRLGSLLTDSSFMTTRPNVYLALVDHDEISIGDIEKPLHKEPVFLNVDKFYVAIARGKVKVTTKDYIVPTRPDRIINEVALFCGMTAQAAMLALPHIQDILGRRIKFDVGVRRPFVIVPER